MDNLSEHDSNLVRQIEELNERYGWTHWPDMSALAEQLDDQATRDFWNNTCKAYCLYERGRAGDL